MSRTKIAYFDPFGAYLELQDQLASKLPLVNLHWNPPSRPLRSIPTLDVDLVEETVVTEQTPKHQMLGLSSAPYLKVMFVRCDDSETYRNSVRTMVREWLNNNVNSTRDPTEWLIVYYISQPKSGSSSHRFKSSVYDKIRADFNSGSKKDRCLQIRSSYPSEMESMEVWSEMMTRIKERVLEAFSKRVDLYEDEVRKLEAKKNVMGWNFGTFFYMKEGLALSFENISLYEDALILYDELEAGFASMSRQKNVTFFSSVGFDFDTPPGSILELQHGSEMRRQIMSNEISLFDFHCYLFGRQAYLLIMISKASSSPSISASKIGELYIRLRTFITEMVGLLESNKKEPLMVAEWTFNVVQEFEAATLHTPEGIDWLVSEGRGEMKVLSRKALETMAALKGWLIKGPLAEVSLEAATAGDDSYQVKNETMRGLLETEDSFYQAYRDLTNDASQEFDLSNRVRTVNRLSSQLALLDYQLGNYEAACKQLENIPNMYSRQGWDVISTSLLSIYVKCLVKLDQKENILAYSLDLLCQHKFLHSEEVKELVGNVQRLCGVAKLEVTLDSFFKIEVDPNVYPNADTPGRFEITIAAKTVFNCDFELDAAKIVLMNIRDSTDQIILDCDASPVIKASGGGPNKLVFGRNKFAKGRFKLHSITMMREKLVFTKRFDDEPVIIDMFQTPHSLHTELRVPRLLALPERRFALDIYAVEQVTQCVVVFKAMSSGVRLTTGTATAHGVDHNTDLDLKETGPLTVTIGAFDERATIEVPYVASFDTKRIQIRASIEYTTDNGTTFSYMACDELDVMLAIDVNVHDYFKKSKLLSKFSVSCKNGFEPVRVIRANLQGTDHFQASSPFGTDEPVVAFPGGPVSYVYAINRLPNQEKEEELQLTISHRYVKDECAMIMWQEVVRALHATPQSRYSMLVKPLIKSIGVDLRTFALEGWFTVPPQSIQRVEAAPELECIPDQERADLVNTLLDVLDKRFVAAQLQDSQQSVHDLKIPVAVPQVHVIHGINLELPALDHYVIGQVIDVKMTIQSVRTWRPLTDAELREMNFNYEILAPQESWAITGKSRSQFVLQSEETSQFETRFSMIPLKTGKLALPKVDVSVDPSSPIKMELDHMNGGETALVVPEFDRLSISW